MPDTFRCVYAISCVAIFWQEEKYFMTDGGTHMDVLPLPGFELYTIQPVAWSLLLAVVSLKCIHCCTVNPGWQHVKK
jgi:hypothetical protein